MRELPETFEQALTEWTQMRDRVNLLEKEKRDLEIIKEEKQMIEHSLGERVKELNCLYTLSQIIEKNINNLNAMLEEAVNLMPISWQYPDITCSRIVIEGRAAETANYQRCRWTQKSNIMFADHVTGEIEVAYIKEMPDSFEGPFLREERLLIDAVAYKLGRTVERMQISKQLVMEKDALKNTNIALREVLSRVQDEKREVAESVQANINKIILPLLMELEGDMPDKYKVHVRLLKSNLLEIAEPFADKLSKNFLSLTPAELQICNMIRSGMSSKEIARLKGIAPSTVNRHREHIRKKLGITNSEINLITYLDSFMREASQVYPPTLMG